MPAPLLRELRFGAMGTEALIACHGADAAALAERGRSELAALERRWTRFDPASELSALNDAAGTGPFVLSRPTFDLVTAAIDAWRLTSGYFDPTVATALVAAGYDQSYEQLARVRPPASGRPTPGPAGIVVDPENRSVALPPGVALDLGGIGKGRAADLVARRLLEDGATGVCVDLGGDVALAGVAPDGEGWTIGVDDWGESQGGVPLWPGRVLRVGEGAVATSATAGRTWATAEGPAHHLIDPATGRPCRSGVRAVTVLAAQAMWAEVVAKAALIAGPVLGVELLADSGACGFLVDDDGRHLPVGDLSRFVA